MLTLAASAAADVPRYQTQSATLTATVLGGAYVHEYAIAINPCDGSFTGTGGIASLALNENVSGTLDGSTIDFDATYTTYNPGYQWSYDGPLAGGTGYGPNGQTFHVAFALTNVVDTSTWKNHGQYVKAQGGGSDAAHSCLGMPIPYSWSESGTIDSTSMAGTTTSVPVDGTYRIDVSGTWMNTPHGPVDAEYTSLDNWATHEDGFDHAPYLLGAGFGDLQVNGQFVDWGAYSATHAYSLTTALIAGSLHLGIFDGDSTIPMQMAWYGDNNGTLNYTSRTSAPSLLRDRLDHRGSVARRAAGPSRFHGQSTTQGGAHGCDHCLPRRTPNQASQRARARAPAAPAGHELGRSRDQAHRRGVNVSAAAAWTQAVHALTWP